VATAAAWSAAAPRVAAGASEITAPALAVDPTTPGDSQPTAGRSLFQTLFADGVPFPFSRLLERLREEAGADNVATALVPLGRSLQRFSAHPRYFASPRIVVAITGDRAAGPGTSRLADRLFVGYQPAAEVMEVLSYNEDAGRFEFQEIVGYAGDRHRDIRQADRRVCVACHQGHAPIFTRPLWSETNANPAVAERLAALGEVFHGAPVRQSIDTLARFNASTDRAARLALANRLWSDACASARCRARLLVAALRFGLNGSRPEWNAQQDQDAAAFAARAVSLWPNGLAAPSPSLVNRDPMPLVATMPPEQIIETKGDLNPETPRPLELLWQPGSDAFSSAARAIAADLAPGDFGWLDSRLQRVAKASETVHGLACSNAMVVRPGGTSEFRFDCTGGDHALRGFLTNSGDAGRGRVDRLRVAGAATLGNLAIRSQTSGDVLQLEARLASARGTLAPRLEDGRRIARLEIRSADTPAASARIVLCNDLAFLARRLAAAAEADEVRLGAGQPLRRRQVLELLASLLED
jgi:hypothetical protein